MIDVNFIEYMRRSDFIEHMRRSDLYRAYAKELIIYLNLIILIQVDRQSESAILWINFKFARQRESIDPSE